MVSVPQGAPDHVLLSQSYAIPSRHHHSHCFSTTGTSWAPRLWWNHHCWSTEFLAMTFQEVLLFQPEYLNFAMDYLGHILPFLPIFITHRLWQPHGLGLLFLSNSVLSLCPSRGQPHPSPGPGPNPPRARLLASEFVCTPSALSHIPEVPFCMVAHVNIYQRPDQGH